MKAPAEALLDDEGENVDPFRAWSVMMAGCGLKPGVVVGKTTANGAWCDHTEFDIGHLFHTIFHCLGIDPHKTEYDNNGQPLPIAHDDCGPIKEVMA